MENKRNIESKLNVLKEKNNQFIERQGKSRIEDSTDINRYSNNGNAEFALRMFKSDLREIKNAVKELSEELRKADEFSQETKIEYEIIEHTKKCLNKFNSEVEEAEGLQPHELPQTRPQTVLNALAVRRKTQKWLNVVS